MTLHKTTLREVLEKQGRKQKWIAEQIGLNKDAVSRIVNGKHIPSLRTAQRISELLDVSINELWPLPNEDEA